MAAEAQEKKRKRDSESEEKPRKKKTVVNGIQESTLSSSAKSNDKSSSINIKHIPRSDLWAPVIVSSPGLSIPLKTSFSPFRSRNQDELLLHSSAHPQVDYLAREKQDGGLQGHLKHYIAVYDPQEKELKIVEGRHMSMRSILRAEEQEQQGQQAAKNTATFGQLRDRLGLEFGNKKTKRYIQDIAQNAINTMRDPAAAIASPEAMKEAIKANPSASAVLESMAEAAETAPAKEELQAAMDAAKPGPKRNADSRKAQDHYTVESLIGNDVFQAVKVKPWFEALDANEGVDTPSHFVLKRIKPIYDADLDDAVMKAKILRWMEILLKFFWACKKVRGGGLKLPKQEDLAKNVGEDSFLLTAVKKRFAPMGGDMTKWHVDNLMTHLAVMSLVVDDYKTNTHDLMKDLYLEPKQFVCPGMSLYFREAGAKVVEMTDAERGRAKIGKVEARQHKIAKLEDELDFPQARPPISRGNRR